MWHFVKLCRMPSGGGNGFLLQSEDGLELVIRYRYKELTTSDEALDWANMHVRLLDTETVPASKWIHGA